MTGFSSQPAAWPSTCVATCCSWVGTPEAVAFRNVTSTAPTIAPAKAIFFGLYSVSSTDLLRSSSEPAAQLGMMRWSTSCVSAPAPTTEAQALKRKPRPKEK